MRILIMRSVPAAEPVQRNARRRLSAGQDNRRVCDLPYFNKTPWNQDMKKTDSMGFLYASKESAAGGGFLCNAPFLLYAELAEKMI